MLIKNSQNLISYPESLIQDNSVNVQTTPYIEMCSAGLVPNTSYAIRTLDYPSGLFTNIVIYPRNEHLSSKDPNGETSISWTSKFGIVGFAVCGKENDEGNVIEAMNTERLKFSALTLNQTVYQTVPLDEMNKALALSDLPLYILGKCATIDDIKKALPEVFVWGNLIPLLGEYKAHFMFVDANLQTLIVEYLNGQLTFSSGPVLTNDPPYNQQKLNLEKYKEVNPGYAPGSTSIGSGMSLLPGGWSSEDRFVRLSKLFEFMIVEKGCEFQCSEQMIGSVEVLNGMKLAHPDKNDKIYDRTHWKTITDMASLKIFYKTAYAQMWRDVDLTIINFDGEKRISERIYYPEISRNPETICSIPMSSFLNQKQQNQEDKKEIITQTDENYFALLMYKLGFWSMSSQ